MIRMLDPSIVFFLGVDISVLLERDGNKTLHVAIQVTSASKMPNFKKEEIAYGT